MFSGSPIAAVFKDDKLRCFDVGALNGFRELQALNAIIDLVAFEPDEAACDNLNKSIYPAAGFYSARAWPLALSDSTGEQLFYLTGNGAMNSLLKPAPEKFDVLFGEAAGSKYWREQLVCKTTRTIKTDTLENFCTQENISNIDLLKLDTQGAEMQVLRGAANLLSNNAISIIKTEVSLYRIYENQCLFGDVDVFLRSKNYELIDCDFTPEQVINVGEKAINQKIKLEEKTRFYPVGDAVYVKHPEQLTPEQATRAACVLLAWGYTGMARKLLARKNDLQQTEGLLNQFANLHKSPKRKSLLKELAPPLLWKYYKKMRRK